MHRSGAIPPRGLFANGQSANVSLACADPGLGHSVYSSKRPLDSLYQLTFDLTTFLLTPTRSM